jgi:hypothetical protein
MEFAGVGARCSAQLCGQHDFLPVLCSNCGASFCAMHSSPSAHGCVALESSYSASGAAHHPPFPRCAVAGCLTPASLASRATCSACGAVTCLSHRFQDQHSCAALATASAPPRRVASAAAAAAAGTVAVAHQSKPLVAPPAARALSGSGLADKVRRMRIKSKAVLNTAIPEAQRVFVEVRGGPLCPPPATVAPLCLCASRLWTVGSLLDAACKARGVINPNSSTPDEARRFHVYYVGSEPGLVRLSFSDSLGALEEAGMHVDGACFEVTLGLEPLEATESSAGTAAP